MYFHHSHRFRPPSTVLSAYDALNVGHNDAQLRPRILAAPHNPNRTCIFFFKKKSHKDIELLFEPCHSPLSALAWHSWAVVHVLSAWLSDAVCSLKNVVGLLTLAVCGCRIVHLIWIVSLSPRHSPLLRSGSQSYVLLHPNTTDVFFKRPTLNAPSAGRQPNPKSKFLGHILLTTKKKAPPSGDITKHPHTKKFTVI